MRQMIEWEKTFLKYASDKGLMQKYETLKKHTTSKQTIQLRTQKDMHTIFQNVKHKCP